MARRQLLKQRPRRDSASKLRQNAKTLAIIEMNDAGVIRRCPLYASKKERPESIAGIIVRTIDCECVMSVKGFKQQGHGKHNV